LFVNILWIKQHPLFELAVAYFQCHVGRANGEIEIPLIQQLPSDLSFMTMAV